MAALRRRRGRGSNRSSDPLLIRAVGWFGVVQLALFVLALVASGLTQALGHDSREVVGGALVVSFCLAALAWIVWGVLSTNLVRDGRWYFGETTRERVERVGTVVIIGVIVLGPVLTGLAALPFLEDMTAEGIDRVTLVAALGPVALGLLAAATAGAVLLGGWWAAPVGVAFGAGFGLYVYGLVAGGRLDTAGLLLLGLSCGGFTALGARTGHLPVPLGANGPAAAAALAGLALGAAGTVTGFPLLALLGTLTVATVLGGRLGARLGPAGPRRSDLSRRRRDVERRRAERLRRAGRSS